MKTIHMILSISFGDNMLRGYTSIYWLHAYNNLCESYLISPNPSWDSILTSTSIQILKRIWENRNKYVNGHSKSDQRNKLRSRIIEQVQSIYANPPRLHRRFQRIHKVSLKDRSNCSTNQLIHWLSRIQHQKQISKLLREKEELAQPSIRCFLVPLPVSEGIISSKFPPYEGSINLGLPTMVSPLLTSFFS